MEIQPRSAPGVAVLRLVGRIDHEDKVAKLSRILDEALRKGCRTILLDLEPTASLLSFGVSFFLDAHDMMEAGGGQLILVNTPKPIGSMLTVAGLNSVFAQHATVAAGLAALELAETDLSDGLPTGPAQGPTIMGPRLRPQAGKRPT